MLTGLITCTVEFTEDSHTIYLNILKYDSFKKSVTYSQLLLCLCFAYSPGKENINEAKQRGANKTRGLEGNL